MITRYNPHLDVIHVEIVDPGIRFPGKSNEVNDYLSMPGWLLLAVGVESDQDLTLGRYAHVYYSMGWAGEGPPIFPGG